MRTRILSLPAAVTCLLPVAPRAAEPQPTGRAPQAGTAGSTGPLTADQQAQLGHVEAFVKTLQAPERAGSSL